MDYSYSVKKNTSGTVDVKMGGFILDLGWFDCLTLLSEIETFKFSLSKQSLDSFHLR